MLKNIFASFLFLISLSTSGQNSSLDPIVKTVTLSEPIPAFGRLGGVTIDQLGNTYIADFRDKVFVVDPSGQTELFASGFYGASGNTVDPQGYLYQSNFFANTLLKLDRSGEVVESYSDGLNGPVGVTIDKEGTIYVCNCNTNTVAVLNQRGELVVTVENSLFNCPNGITTGQNDEIFVTNYHNDVIVRIDKENQAHQFTTVPPGDGIAHIAYLNNNYYVTKIKANTLHMVSPNGESKLIAGSYQGRSITDGQGTKAEMSTPNGIAAHPWGSTLMVNNLEGDWVISGIAPKGNIKLREVDIRTISEVFDQMLESEGLEAAEKAFWAYKNDPLHKHEDTGIETGTYGWQLMIQRKVPEAIRVFELQSESYPDRWIPYYYLGQVYTMIGQNDKAIEYFTQSLDKKPNNPVVETKLKALLP